MRDARKESTLDFIVWGAAAVLTGFAPVIAHLITSGL